MGSRAALATIAGFAVCQSLGATENSAVFQDDTERSKIEWEFSLSTFTYLAQHERDYVNPNFSADYGRLHLEARYNYEALKTGSVWIGYNFRRFTIAKDLEINATPMLGGVFWRYHRCRSGLLDRSFIQNHQGLHPGGIFFSMLETIPTIFSTAGRSSVRRCQRQIASEPVLWSNAPRPRAIPRFGADRSSVSTTNTKTKMSISQSIG
jgi:hypothetical protein